MREAAFLLEGARALQTVLDAGWPVEVVLCGPQAAAADLARWRAAGLRVQPVSAAVLQSVCDEVHPSGCAAIVPQPGGGLGEPWPALLLIADEIRDPGNVGSLLRTADAVGAGVLLSGGCADLFSPKVVRASVGALVRVPWLRCRTAEAMAAVERDGRPVVVLDTVGKGLYDEPLPLPVALVAGNEAHGVSPAWRATGECRRIPMQSAAESLNVGVAVAVALYEVVRQHGLAEGTEGA